MKNLEKEQLIVKGIEVSYKRINEEDYICLTDIAKFKQIMEPRFLFTIG